MTIVRRYEASDRAAVWTLHNAALDDVGAHGGNGPWDDDLHHIERVYLENGGEFLVAGDEHEIVGMGALQRRSSDVAAIRRMRVLPRYQGRGIGAHILQRLEDRAIELSYRTLVLDTTTVQRRAIRLYRAHGYTQTGTGVVGDFDVLYFEKRLAPDGQRASPGLPP